MANAKEAGKQRSREKVVSNIERKVEKTYHGSEIQDDKQKDTVAAGRKKCQADLQPSFPILSSHR